MSNPTPTGKVIILKDNERVISKWSYWLWMTASVLFLISFVLRLIAWVVS